MKKVKLQSAMEYLMTYGWAILIIALIMVVIFSISGQFNGNPFPTQCQVQSGYECSNPIFSSATGNLILTVGQSTSQDWITTNVYIVAQGTGAIGGVPASIISLPAGGNAITGGLARQQTAQINIPVAPPGVAVGTYFAGSIWTAYTLNGNPQIFYAQIGAITGKAA